MSSIGSDGSVDAEAMSRKLAERRKKIEASRLASPTAKSDKTGIHEDYVLNPSEKKHSDKIKSFGRVSLFRNVYEYMLIIKHSIRIYIVKVCNLRL
jgi:hypothetical protein